MYREGLINNGYLREIHNGNRIQLNTVRKRRFKYEPEEAWVRRKILIEGQYREVGDNPFTIEKSYNRLYDEVLM